MAAETADGWLPRQLGIGEIEITTAKRIIGLVHGFFCAKDHDQRADLILRSGDPLHFAAGADYFSNVRILHAAHVFEVHTQRFGGAAFGDHTDRPRIAVGDGTYDLVGPERIFAPTLQHWRRRINADG